MITFAEKSHISPAYLEKKQYLCTVKSALNVKICTLESAN